MSDILRKVNNYVSKIGTIKIEKVLYSKKDRLYMFFFEKNHKDEDDYQECILANQDTGEIIIKNLLTLMVEEDEHKYSNDYEEVTKSGYMGYSKITQNEGTMLSSNVK